MASLIGLFTFARCEEVAFAGIVLMYQHRTIVQLHKDDEDHHQQGEQGVEVEGDRLNEDADAILPFDESRYRCGPRRDGGNDTDGGCRRVDQIGQFGSADLVLVGDRSHDGTYRQTVKVIVNENQTAQQHG